MPHPAAPMTLRDLGRADYAVTVDAMRAFTAARTPATPDELWLCEHPPVFTQGVAGRAQHLRFDPQRAGDIPVVASDRGGQVTYHGPGQVVAYPLVDLQRLGIYVKEYVFRLEQATLRTLDHFGVTGHRIAGAPGIYVLLADPFGHAAPTGPRDAADPWRGIGKIAALGIKVSRHRAYHGVALNVAMDLSPYGRIDPCGHAGLATVDLATIGVAASWADAAAVLADKLALQLAPRGGGNDANTAPDAVPDTPDHTATSRTPSATIRPPPSPDDEL